MCGLSAIYHMLGTVGMVLGAGSWELGHGTCTPGTGVTGLGLCIHIYICLSFLPRAITSGLRYVCRALVRWCVSALVY